MLAKRIETVLEEKTSKVHLGDQTLDVILRQTTNCLSLFKLCES